MSSGKKRFRGEEVMNEGKRESIKKQCIVEEERKVTTSIDAENVKENKKSPAKDSSWASDSWYYSMEKEIDKMFIAEEEAKAEMERKKRLREEHAKQLAEIPKLNLFEDEQLSLDKEEELDKDMT